MKSTPFCKVSSIISAVSESWGDNENMMMGKTHTRIEPSMMIPSNHFDLNFCLNT